MRMRIAGLVAGTLALLASPVQAEDELPGDVAARDGAVKLEPISPWNADFGEDRCRLTRLFGPEDNRHILFIDQESPSVVFSLTIGGPELADYKGAPNLELGMERDEPMESSGFFYPATLDRFGPAIVFPSVTIFDEEPGNDNEKVEGRKEGPPYSLDLQEANSIERFVVTRGKRILSFEAGNMKAPFDVLNQCTRDLIRTWGLDVNQHKVFTPPRWKNQISIAKRLQEAYPSGPLNSREQGVFSMRVIVEPDGKISDCHLHNATVTESLDSPACEEMRRARFDPALNANGDPMRSYFSTRILYRAR